MIAKFYLKKGHDVTSLFEVWRFEFDVHVSAMMSLYVWIIIGTFADRIMKSKKFYFSFIHGRYVNYRGNYNIMKRVLFFLLFLSFNVISWKDRTTLDKWWKLESSYSSFDSLDICEKNIFSFLINFVLFSS